MKLIWTNGTFDVLHVGHIRMLKYARSLGDKLVVAVDTDDKIRRDKGINRPINSLAERIEFLQGIKGVDEVISFSSREELEELVKIYRPDVMVVGSDWEGKEVVGSKFAKEVKYFDRVPGFSSTNIIKRLQE